MMAKTLRGSGSTNILFQLYLKLRSKNRTPEEEEIFQYIDKKCGRRFEESDLCYYEMNKDTAEVSYSTYYGRLKRGWSREKSLTTKPNFFTKPKNETEVDIINFLKNDLPLTPRQKDYIERYPKFAEKLKREGIC